MLYQPTYSCADHPVVQQARCELPAGHCIDHCTRTAEGDFYEWKK